MGAPFLRITPLAWARSAVVAAVRRILTLNAVWEDGQADEGVRAGPVLVREDDVT